jgi:hypothetical protein
MLFGGGHPVLLCIFSSIKFSFVYKIDNNLEVLVIALGSQTSTLKFNIFLLHMYVGM